MNKEQADFFRKDEFIRERMFEITCSTDGCDEVNILVDRRRPASSSESRWSRWLSFLGTYIEQGWSVSPPVCPKCRADWHTQDFLPARKFYTRAKESS